MALPARAERLRALAEHVDPPEDAAERCTWLALRALASETSPQTIDYDAIADFVSQPLPPTSQFMDTPSTHRLADVLKTGAGKTRAYKPILEAVLLFQLAMLDDGGFDDAESLARLLTQRIRTRKTSNPLLAMRFKLPRVVQDAMRLAAVTGPNIFAQQKGQAPKSFKLLSARIVWSDEDSVMMTVKVTGMRDEVIKACDYIAAQNGLCTVADGLKIEELAAEITTASGRRGGELDTTAENVLSGSAAGGSAAGSGSNGVVPPAFAGAANEMSMDDQVLANAFGDGDDRRSARSNAGEGSGASSSSQNSDDARAPADTDARAGDGNPLQVTCVSGKASDIVPLLIASALHCAVLVDGKKDFQKPPGLPSFGQLLPAARKHCRGDMARAVVVALIRLTAGPKFHFDFSDLSLGDMDSDYVMQKLGKILSCILPAAQNATPGTPWSEALLAFLLPGQRHVVSKEALTELVRRIYGDGVLDSLCSGDDVVPGDDFLQLLSTAKFFARPWSSNRVPLSVNILLDKQNYRAKQVRYIGPKERAKLTGGTPAEVRKFRSAALAREADFVPYRASPHEELEPDERRTRRGRKTVVAVEATSEYAQFVAVVRNNERLHGRAPDLVAILYKRILDDPELVDTPEARQVVQSLKLAPKTKTAKNKAKTAKDKDKTPKQGDRSNAQDADGLETGRDQSAGKGQGGEQSRDLEPLLRALVQDPLDQRAVLDVWSLALYCPMPDKSSKKRGLYRKRKPGGTLGFAGKPHPQVVGQGGAIVDNNATAAVKRKREDDEVDTRGDCKMEADEEAEANFSFADSLINLDGLKLDSSSEPERSASGFRRMSRSFGRRPRS